MNASGRGESLAVFTTTCTEIEAHLLVGILRGVGIPALVDVSNPIVQEMTFAPQSCVVWVPLSLHELAREVLGVRVARTHVVEATEALRDCLLREIRESYTLLLVGLLLPFGLISGPMACRSGSRALAAYYRGDLDDEAIERRLEQLQVRVRAYTVLYYGATVWLLSQLR